MQRLCCCKRELADKALRFQSMSITSITLTTFTSLVKLRIVSIKKAIWIHLNVAVRAWRNLIDSLGGSATVTQDITSTDLVWFNDTFLSVSQSWHTIFVSIKNSWGTIVWARLTVVVRVIHIWHAWLLFWIANILVCPLFPYQWLKHFRNLLTWVHQVLSSGVKLE